MPFPNEHSCRLRDPEGLETVGSDERQHDDKTYRVIFGKPKDGNGSVEQAYRYPRESWGEEAARSHCQDHSGAFEAAEKTASFHLHVLTEKADPDAKIFPWSMPARYYMKPGRMILCGTALVAGQTRKGDIYTHEELTRHGCTLIGGPVELFEHSWDVGEPRWLPYPDNIVLDAEEVEGRLEYIAGVEEPKVQELIDQGEITRVSVNAICRHVPADNPGLCEGMILNGFCLLHKTGIPSSPGTYVKIWNSYRTRHLESEGGPRSSESDGANQMSEKEKEKKTEQVPDPTATAPIAGVAVPSVEDRVTALETEVAQIKQSLTEINAKLDTLIQTKPEPTPVPAAPPIQIPPATTPPVVVTAQGTKTAQEPGESPPDPKEEATVEPKEGEEYEQFMSRCRDAGKELEECATIWREAHPNEGEKEEGEPKTETVTAAVKPVETQGVMVVVTEQEILDVFKDKRRFTPALQVNGILDLLEQKHREAEA